MHETLEWLQHQTSEHGSVPPTKSTIDYFRTRMEAKQLTEQRKLLEIERGEKALTAWTTQRSHILRPMDVAEKNFGSEGVVIDDVRMSGRIDRLEIDQKNKTIVVVDYKTGRPHSSWRADPKLHRYNMQLYVYKLLIEHSLSYRDYTVVKGRLEFIEPDERGKVHALEVTFDPIQVARVTQLVHAVWNHVHALEFPLTTDYAVSLAGIKAFEQDLIDGKT